MTGYGPPGNGGDDEPTRYAADYSEAGDEPTRYAADYSETAYGGREAEYDGVEAAAEPEPTPWYRKPAALVAWGVAIAILIAVIGWGVLELTGTDGKTPAITSSTTTTTTATAPTSTATTAAPIAPATTTVPTTTTTTAPTTTTTTTTTTTPSTATTTTTTTPSTATTTTTSTSTALPGAVSPQSQITLPQLPTVINLPPGL